MGEIALLKQHLAEAQAKVASTSAHARKLADEKMSLLVEMGMERAESEKYKTSFLWVLEYLEQGKSRLIANLDEHHQSVQSALERQESKLRKLNIKYDEELYTHLVSTIVERM